MIVYLCPLITCNLHPYFHRLLLFRPSDEGKTDAHEVISNRSVCDRLEEVHMNEVDRVERLILKLLHDLEEIVEKVSQIISQTRINSPALPNSNENGFYMSQSFADGNDVDAIAPSVLPSSNSKKVSPTKQKNKSSQSKKVELDTVNVGGYEVIQDVFTMLSLELWRKEKVFFFFCCHLIFLLC